MHKIDENILREYHRMMRMRKLSRKVKVGQRVLWHGRPYIKLYGDYIMCPFNHTVEYIGWRAKVWEV